MPVTSSNALRPFEAHGVEFTSERGDERIGTCPFTGKPDKFYVNVKKGLWDSKTAGLSGNVSHFLRQMSKMYESQFTKERLDQLADNRNLPAKAFLGWHIGWDGRRYTIPVSNQTGEVVDIRMYALGGQMMSTAGCNVGLLGAERLTKRSEPVYLFEGEWDTIAASYLMRKIGIPGVAVGVPGAGTFKPEWATWLQGRDVHTHYDKDAAGDAGEQLAEKLLTGMVSELSFVHWPDDLPEGFDVRDWIVYGVDKKTPKKCWGRLMRLYEDRPRLRKLPPAKPHTFVFKKKKGKVKLVWKKPPTLADVHAMFQKWLFLDSTKSIDVLLATIMSQRMEGPPVWMFLVGPPGSAKTELISSLSDLDEVYATSTVTPHALISGANFQGQKQDPSLIPRLDGKILVVKDFTAVMGAKDQDKEEIFSILRDAYDGQCGKFFGNGVERRYKSRFTVLAAVTPMIYDLGHRHAQLGERFLKFSMADNLNHPDEYQIIERAIDNTDKETKMRKEIRDVVREFVDRTLKAAVLPDIPDHLKNKIIWLGRFGARMRGTVSRDSFRENIMTSRPTAEVGSRLGIQLAKLCRSLAMLNQRESVNEDDYVIVKKVMLDTVMQRTEDILRAIYVNDVRGELSTKEIAKLTRYPIQTVLRLLQDLHVLDIVTRSGSSYRHRWRVSPYVRECITNSGLYQTPEELTRETGLQIRLVKKGKRKFKLASKLRGTPTAVPPPALVVPFPQQKAGSSA
jgi:hypothetical protein